MVHCHTLPKHFPTSYLKWFPGKNQMNNIQKKNGIKQLHKITARPYPLPPTKNQKKRVSHTPVVPEIFSPNPYPLRGGLESQESSGESLKQRILSSSSVSTMASEAEVGAGKFGGKRSRFTPNFIGKMYQDS